MQPLKSLPSVPKDIVARLCRPGGYDNREINCPFAGNSIDGTWKCLKSDPPAAEYIQGLVDLGQTRAKGNGCSGPDGGYEAL
jgi:hypothetical protein